MNTLEAELKRAIAQDVSVSDESLTVDLDDGRTIVVPISWFPRLMTGTTAERTKFRFVGKGTGIHWPDLDEDISIESLLAGRRSGETQASLQRWLLHRRASLAPGVEASTDSFEIFCQRVVACVEPSAVLKTNLRVGSTEFDAVLEGQEAQPDVLIEFKSFPRNMEYEWLNTIRHRLLSSAQVYQKALFRQPRLLLLIVKRSGHVSQEEMTQQTSASGGEYKGSQFPLRIEFLSDSAIEALTCERVRSLLYE